MDYEDNEIPLVMNCTPKVFLSNFWGAVCFDTAFFSTIAVSAAIILPAGKTDSDVHHTLKYIKRTAPGKDAVLEYGSMRCYFFTTLT